MEDKRKRIKKWTHKNAPSTYYILTAHTQKYSGNASSTEIGQKVVQMAKMAHKSRIVEWEKWSRQLAARRQHSGKQKMKKYEKQCFKHMQNDCIESNSC